MSQKKDSTANFLFKGSVFTVAEAIFSKPHTKFHLRGLAQVTGFSTTAIIAAVNRLQQAKILLVEKTPLTTNIQANKESDAYRTYKRIFNLYCLEHCGLVKRLRDACHAETIVLFGSFAHGEDEEKSDIDLLVLAPGKKDKGINKALAPCESYLQKPINVQLLTSLEKSSQEFKNAVANGIVLYGYLKVV